MVTPVKAKNLARAQGVLALLLPLWVFHVKETLQADPAMRLVRLCGCGCGCGWKISEILKILICRLIYN